MLIFIYILIFFGSMAWFFQKNSPKNETIAKIGKRCPCTRLAKSGFLSKLLIYTSIAVFVINGLMLDYVGFNKDNTFQLFLALVLVFLGYKVKKE